MMKAGHVSPDESGEVALKFCKILVQFNLWRINLLNSILHIKHRLQYAWKVTSADVCFEEVVQHFAKRKGPKINEYFVTETLN